MGRDLLKEKGQAMVGKAEQMDGPNPTFPELFQTAVGIPSHPR